MKYAIELDAYEIDLSDEELSALRYLREMRSLTRATATM